ncbi:MAG: Uncharacterized protein G01um101493_449 [Microgenomates group bacterium Gr01-1014_93]|nr:MAG: Uncharacterized protein G01um101493_449 [Microgenomates group bacterium Gr01-1014_93]
MKNLNYRDVITIESLFQAWDEFKKGKRKKWDVQLFERHLEDNIFTLNWRLTKKIYRHAPYTAFNIYDPKFRHIHKATVADRIVHHALVSKIEPIFDKGFIYDSYSCRKNKGTHMAVKRLAVFIRKVSRNYTGECFCLKLDIKKFFESIDHEILLSLIKKKLEDQDLIWLLTNILKSFSLIKGIPIGNLTSQIFANIYLNELDHFIKHKLGIKYYIRYADDFVILSDDKLCLETLVPRIAEFLKEKLDLSLHPNKILIRKYTQGIDFLGYIVLPNYILPRTKTKKRIFKKLKELISSASFDQSLQSYLGYLSHANSYRIDQQLKNMSWFLIE